MPTLLVSGLLPDPHYLMATGHAPSDCRQPVRCKGSSTQSTAFVLRSYCDLSCLPLAQLWLQTCTSGVGMLPGLTVQTPSGIKPRFVQS